MVRIALALSQLASVLVLSAPTSAPSAPPQAGLQNGTFEHDEVGSPPSGWVLPKPCADGGYRLEVTDSSAAQGKRSAKLSGAGGKANTFGNCVQGIDPAPYRGKRVRFSASVRCEPKDGASDAQLWLRVDRPEKQMGFFDNMGDRPIKSADWQRYEIVGDIAKDADRIVLGMLLIGGGTAMFDEAELEVVEDDVPITGRASAGSGAPGLAVVVCASKVHVLRAAEKTTLRFPLPLAYRDQTPLTFRLALEPAELEASATISEGLGPNRVLELELRDIEPRTDMTLRYESVVLVAPTPFDDVPARAAFPAEWPAEAKPWLASTWCCDADDERIHKLGADLHGAGDVRAVVAAVLGRSQSIFQKAQGRVSDLTAVEALDKQGSCTSCANLVAALMRASGVPARILAGYPLWSGPLQTHYIVEAWVPGFGWYPVESTMGQEPWANCQQINVSIVPVEHEGEELAGRRPCAAGAVPFLSLTEYEENSPVSLEGTLKPYCDHEARLLRPIEAQAAEWKRTQDWARERWEKWLASKPEIRAGKLELGPSSEGLASKTLAELRRELR